MEKTYEQLEDEMMTDIERRIKTKDFWQQQEKDFSNTEVWQLG